MTTNEYLIINNDNHYIVNYDEPVDGDVVINFKNKEYKVVWCYEKNEKYTYVFFTFPVASGATFSFHLISEDLIPVQPLEAPRADIHFFDYQYNHED